MRTYHPDMPDFEHIERRINAAKVFLSPAEAQGLLCGLLCHVEGNAHKRWIDEVLDKDGVPAASLSRLQAALDELFASTQAALQDQNFAFEPMLPNERRPISERAQALCDWCQGFLYGLGLSGKPVEKQLSEHGREALKDLTEFTRIEASDIEGNEENETAFIEIEEFLRVAVMTIYDDLAPGQGEAP